MSAEGAANDVDKDMDEVEVISIPSQDDHASDVMENQLQCVTKHIDNISSFVIESSQLKIDALKCFGDNVIEMKKLEEETDLKAEAFRNLVTMVGLAVGTSKTSNSN